jgi:hypothetical protein
MDAITRTHMEALWSGDSERRYQAFLCILQVTEKQVDWAYEVWDDVVAKLDHRHNHVRAIAAQLLCNLTKSDPQHRILKDFPALLAVTRDKRFVTARHCLQAIWKVGTAGTEQQELVIAGLADRFRECASEKNVTLIRYDIIQGLWKLYEKVKDDSIREQALCLIETEDNIKYRKKYARVWRVK